MSAAAQRQARGQPLRQVRHAAPRRAPLAAVSAAPCLWPGGTVVCVAGGPSLTAADVEACRGLPMVVVNNGYELAPWADALYACDDKWWKWHKGAPGFAGLKFAMHASAGRWPGVRLLRNTGADGLETQPWGVRHGRNSGYQAVNLTHHLVGGHGRALLLGYDMRLGPGGRRHWHGDHPDLSGGLLFTEFRKHFSTLAAALAGTGFEVVNCTRSTALSCFPCVRLEDALAMARAR